MTTLAPSFLIWSSSYFQVTRTSITSRTSSKFGQSVCNNLHRLIYGRNVVNTLAFSFMIGSSSFLQVTRTFQPDTTADSWVICPLASKILMYNVVTTLERFIFDRIFFILAGNKEIYNISNEFKIRPDRTKDCGVSCPWASGKISINLYWEKCCELSSTCIYDQIFFILAGNRDIHESLDEFEFQPDTDADSWVICPCASEKLL